MVNFKITHTVLPAVAANIPEDHMIHIENCWEMSGRELALFTRLMSYQGYYLEYVETTEEDKNTLFEVYPIDSNIKKTDLDFEAMLTATTCCLREVYKTETIMGQLE